MSCQKKLPSILMFDDLVEFIRDWMQEASNLADRLASLVLGRVPGEHGDSEAQPILSRHECLPSRKQSQSITYPPPNRSIVVAPGTFHHVFFLLPFGVEACFFFKKLRLQAAELLRPCRSFLESRNRNRSLESPMCNCFVRFSSSHLFCGYCNHFEK